jgi:hypothetical protein
LTMIDDFRAKVCEFIRHNWERKLIPDRVACADFAWAQANIYALLQETRAEFAWSKMEAMTALAANGIGRVATKLLGSIGAFDLGAPSQHLRDLDAGEYYARRSGRVGVMPSFGEQFYDWHQREGLRAAAVHLREATRR